MTQGGMPWEPSKKRPCQHHDQVRHSPVVECFEAPEPRLRAENFLTVDLVCGISPTGVGATTGRIRSSSTPDSEGEVGRVGWFEHTAENGLRRTPVNPREGALPTSLVGPACLGALAPPPAPSLGLPALEDLLHAWAQSIPFLLRKRGSRVTRFSHAIIILVITTRRSRRRGRRDIITERRLALNPNCDVVSSHPRKDLNITPDPRLVEAADEHSHWPKTRKRLNIRRDRLAHQLRKCHKRRSITHKRGHIIQHGPGVSQHRRCFPPSSAAFTEITSY